MHHPRHPTIPAFATVARAVLLTALTVLAGLPDRADATAVRTTEQTASVQLKVSGTITAGACTVSLSDAGAIDYGVIRRSDIPQNSPLDLGVKTLRIRLECEDPAQIRLTVRDERAGTAVLALRPGEHMLAFGLGSVGGKNIGQYQVVSNPGSFSGIDAAGRSVPIDTLYAHANGSAWFRSVKGAYWGDGSVRHSFASPGKLIPELYSMVEGTLEVQAFIAGRDDLPGGKITLDGLASVQIFYH